MKRKRHILFLLLLALVPVMLARQARAQADTVCVGQSTVWSVVELPGVSYTWELYHDVDGINFVTDPGNCPVASAYFVGGLNTGPEVEVMCLAQGTYFIKVTASDTCTDNLKVGRIEVVPCESYAVFLEPAGACSGDTAWMTLVFSGGPGPWDVTFTNGQDVWLLEHIEESPCTFMLIPTPTDPGTYPYWVTSVVNSLGFVNNTPGEPVFLSVHPIPVTSPIIRYGP